MRIVLWFMALFGIAVASALFAGNNQGTVTLFWAPHRVDLSLNLVLLALALSGSAQALQQGVTAGGHGYLSVGCAKSYRKCGAKSRNVVWRARRVACGGADRAAASSRLARLYKSLSVVVRSSVNRTMTHLQARSLRPAVLVRLWARRVCCTT